VPNAAARRLLAGRAVLNATGIDLAQPERGPRHDIFGSDQFHCAGHGREPGLRPGDRHRAARRGHQGGCGGP
jgi:hypothetical protein